MEEYLSEAVHSALSFFDYSSALWLAEQQLAFVHDKPLPLQTAGRQQLARVYIAMNKYPRALEVLAPCLDPDSNYLKATCHLNVKDYRAAEQVLLQLIKGQGAKKPFDPLTAHVHRILALIYSRTARQSMALSASAKALEADSTLWHVWDIYSSIATKNGSNDLKPFLPHHIHWPTRSSEPLHATVDYADENTFPASALPADMSYKMHFLHSATKPDPTRTPASTSGPLSALGASVSMSTPHPSYPGHAHVPLQTPGALSSHHTFPHSFAATPAGPVSATPAAGSSLPALPQPPHKAPPHARAARAHTGTGTGTSAGMGMGVTPVPLLMSSATFTPGTIATPAPHASAHALSSAPPTVAAPRRLAFNVTATDMDAPADMSAARPVAPDVATPAAHVGTGNGVDMDVDAATAPRPVPRRALRSAMARAPKRAGRRVGPGSPSDFEAEGEGVMRRVSFGTSMAFAAEDASEHEAQGYVEEGEENESEDEGVEGEGEGEGEGVEEGEEGGEGEMQDEHVDARGSSAGVGHGTRAGRGATPARGYRGAVANMYDSGSSARADVVKNGNSGATHPRVFVCSPSPAQRAAISRAQVHLATLCQLHLHVRCHRHSTLAQYLPTLPPALRRSPFVLTSLAASYYHLSLHRSSVLLFERAHSIAPWSTRHFSLYSSALWQERKAPELSHLSHVLLALDEEAPESLVAAGNAASLQGRRSLAYSFFDKATQIHPHYAYAHALKGLELQALGKDGEAIDCLRRALACDAKQYAAWCALAVQCVQSQAIEEAHGHLLRAIEVNQFSPVTQCLLARVRMMVGLRENTTSALQHARTSAVDAVQRANRCVPDLLARTDAAYDDAGDSMQDGSASEAQGLPTITVPSVRPHYVSANVLCGEEGGVGAVCLETLRLLQGGLSASAMNGDRRELAGLLAQTAAEVGERWGGDASARNALGSVLAGEGREEESERCRAIAMALEGQSVSSRRKRKNGQVADDDEDWDQVL